MDTVVAAGTVAAADDTVDAGDTVAAVDTVVVAVDTVVVVVDAAVAAGSCRTFDSERTLVASQALMERVCARRPSTVASSLWPRVAGGIPRSMVCGPRCF